VCIETLAHELGHAWQARHLPRMTELKEREGFAEWVAAKILDDYGFDGLLEKLESRRDLYGDGYRWMKSLERKYGESGVLQYLKNRSKELSPTDSVTVFE
jgi:Zn-dependent peptidase ImmA (M78 family)